MQYKVKWSNHTAVCDDCNREFRIGEDILAEQMRIERATLEEAIDNFEYCIGCSSGDSPDGEYVDVPAKVKAVVEVKWSPWLSSCQECERIFKVGADVLAQAVEGARDCFQNDPQSAPTVREIAESLEFCLECGAGEKNPDEFPPQRQVEVGGRWISKLM